MSGAEFEREFDIEYNNIMSNAAPSIDPYEKAVFLTGAQEEIVTSLYNGSFEQTENATEYLNILVNTEVFDSKLKTDGGDAETVDASKNLSGISKWFKLSAQALFITYEFLELKELDACGNKVEILVKPTKQDDYYKTSKNPFRRARKREALRLNANGMVEIISTYPEYYYHVRYLRRPRPIILRDMQGLTIDGLDGSGTYPLNNPCELDPYLHRIILKRAVQLAAAAYKQ